MSAQERREAFNKQRRDNYHQVNLTAAEAGDGEAAQILRHLSQIDDLPIDPEDDEVMGQLVSKLASTANLSADEVRSNEWYREIILTLYLCMRPTKDGVHGSLRQWVSDDPEDDTDPLDANERIKYEALTWNSKLAASRSEDFRAVIESTRNVSESVVHEEGGDSGGRGGLWGRLTG